MSAWWIWLVTPDDRLLVERADPGAPLDGTQHARLSRQANELPWHCVGGYVDCERQEVVVWEPSDVEVAQRTRVALAAHVGEQVTSWPVRSLTNGRRMPPPLRGCLD